MSDITSKKPDNNDLNIVTVQTDAYGNLFIPLSYQLLKQVGWEEGDVVEWAELDDGHWALTKPNNGA